MNVPTIGGARGIFEIFVPGIFILLNLGMVVYLLPFTDNETKNLIVNVAASPVYSLVMAISFGYLLGVLLRLLRTDLPDKLSSSWLKIFARKEHKHETRLWAIDNFPYIGWIGETCKLYLPPEAHSFYNKTWGSRRLEKQNKQFFNFVKIIISTSDEKAAAEIYAAESLTRYISGMFYALLFAFLLVTTTVISNYVASDRILSGLIFILIGYLFALVEILAHFRFIRIKEVETVFAASYKNKSIFEGTTTWTENKNILPS